MSEYDANLHMQDAWRTPHRLYREQRPVRGTGIVLSLVLVLGCIAVVWMLSAAWSR